MRIAAQQKKWFIIIGGSALLLLGIVLAIGLSKREGILRQAVAKIQNKLKKDYQIDFSIGSYRFDGLTSVVFDRVALVPEQRDALATIRQLGVSVRVLPLLWGEVRIGNLEVADGRVMFVKGDSTSNYDFLFRKQKQDTVLVERPSERNFAEWTERIANQVFSQIPKDLKLQNFEIAYADSRIKQKIRIPEATIDGGNFETTLFLNEHDAEWVLQGYVDGDRQKLRVEASSKEKGAEVPFLAGKYGLKVSFDRIVFDLHHIKRVGNDLLNIDGEMEYHNLV
ncbi:MAG TPA: penicillin-binding protein, partial [Sphingobacterium sp.]|nr:penicillin-binding protein [Sphingobacterium sp.]